MEEIEIKFLEVDIPSLEKKLEQYGAQKIGETLSSVVNFDYPDYRLKEKKAWVRLRSEFGKITLAYKQRLGVTSDDGSTSDDGMKEIECVVSDFETTKQLLLSIGLIEKFRQERKRIRWIKGTIEFDIDTWPLIPPYLEIEGSSWKDVKEASEALGFNYEDHFRGSMGQVFQKYGDDDHNYSVLTFETQIKK